MIYQGEKSEQFASFFKKDSIYPFVKRLYSAMQEGNICIDLSDEEVTSNLSASAFISYSSSDVKPFIIQNNKLYMYKYYIYESTIVEFVKAQVENQLLIEQRVATLSKIVIAYDLIDTFEDLSMNAAVKRIDWQFIAMIKSFINGFSIITGGPGTGKTTTIAKLLRLLFEENPNLSVALAAPTGKAAIRMKEALLGNDSYDQIKELLPEPDSKTIHRLLGAIKNKHHFKKNATNKLDYDVVIVDEASMVDIALMSKLISALQPTTRLILLGDQNQLSAVGTGSLLKDLCDNVNSLDVVSPLIQQLLKSKLPTDQFNALQVIEQKSILQDAITQLQISRRFSFDSHIGKLSTALLLNNKKDIFHKDNPLSTYFTPQKGSDFVHIDTVYSNIYLDEIIENYVAYIKENDMQKALKKLNNTRVLCGVRESEQGVYHTNYVIESMLAKKGLINKNTPFYNNRPIMITKNNPELKIFNGDIGIIRNNMAYFGTGDGEIVELQPALLSEFETVYAMTIHKSQGSEFDNVLVILPKGTDNKILNKQLLYTGVTRAKKRVIIQTTLEVLQQTLDTEVSRVSGIPNRLKTM